MTTSILQRFLDRGLLNIGEDDSRFERLGAAADDLHARILAAPGRTVAYTLLALDPDAPLNDPVFADVHEAIVAHWSTYHSRFADAPRQLYRAVLLEALSRTAKANDAIAGAIAFTAANMVPQVAAASEAGVWDDLVATARRIAEARAAADWPSEYMLTTPKVPAITLKEPKLGTVTVSVEALTSGLQAAAGPNNVQNQAIPNANPHWPGANQHWAQEFGSRAANAIAEAVNDALAAFTAQTVEAVLGAGEQLGTMANTVANATGTALAQFARGAVGIERRSRLLWWKEALYSPSAGVGYRTLGPATAAILMSADLHAQVPPFSPVSVEYLLREAVRAVARPAGEGAVPRVTLEGVCSSLVANGSVTVLRHALGTDGECPGRGPLIDEIGRVLASGTVTPTEFHTRVGIAASTVLPLDELAVWVFRELQARRLAVEAANAEYARVVEGDVAAKGAGTVERGCARATPTRRAAAQAAPDGTSTA